MKNTITQTNFTDEMMNHSYIACYKYDLMMILC